MKRAALIRDIRVAAKAKGLSFELEREGARHELWRCGEVVVAVPRHGELGPKMEFVIRVELEPALGKRWWR